ncbi:MAG: DUF167 domain-containing protein [Candidatus Gracilibacteria bacterium]
MTIEIPKNRYFRVKVIPKSPKTELVEIMEDEEKTLKIRVKAAPEKGKANAELIKFLSREMNIPKENISIVSGKTDHLKLLKIS